MGGKLEGEREKEWSVVSTWGFEQSITGIRMDKGGQRGVCMRRERSKDEPSIGNVYSLTKW